MRRTLTLGRALESDEVFGGTEYAEDLTVEESAVMESEAIELSQELIQDAENSVAMIDKAESLEDLAVVGDGIVEATPAETALIQIAGDMAVAGEEVESEEFVTATESVGRRIATEGIKDVVRNIWEAIKYWIKDAWEKIEKFFYKIFGAIPRLRKDIEALRKRAEKVQDEGKRVESEDKKFELTSGLSSLIVKNEVKTKWADVKEGAANMLAALKAVYTNAATAKAGEDLADAMGEFDGDTKDKAVASAKKVLAEVKNIMDHPGKLIGANSSNKETISGTDYYGAKLDNLLGGRDLIAVSKHDKKGYVDFASASLSETQITTSFERISSLRVEFRDTANPRVKLKDSYKFETMSISDVDSAMDIAEKILDELEDFHRGKGKKDILKAKERIQKAGDSVEKSLDNKDEDLSRTDSATITTMARGVYKLPSMYTRINSVVLTQGYNLGLQTVRTLLMLSSRSLSQYKSN